MKLTSRQLKKVKQARLVAQVQEDDLSQEISRLESELEDLNRQYHKARQVECNATNMLNDVLAFDEDLLEL